jgi:hypothetical protein
MTTTSTSNPQLSIGRNVSADIILTSPGGNNNYFSGTLIGDTIIQSQNVGGSNNIWQAIASTPITKANTTGFSTTVPITATNATSPEITALSGNATIKGSIGIGTNNVKGTVGVCGATNDYLTGTAQNDIVILNSSASNKTHLGIGTVDVMNLTDTSTNINTTVNLTAGGTSALNMLSGLSGLVVGATLGRTVPEAEIIVAAASDQTYTGSVAGDVIIGNTNSGNSIYLGTGTTPLLKLIGGEAVVSLLETQINMADGLGMRIGNLGAVSTTTQTAVLTNNSFGLVTFASQTIAPATTASYTVTISSLPSLSFAIGALVGISGTFTTCCPTYLGLTTGTGNIVFQLQNVSPTTTTPTFSVTFWYWVVVI